MSVTPHPPCLPTGQLYVQMQDLLATFNDPHVMDVKIGFRTFSESDVKDASIRPDLLAKMEKLDAGHITQVRMCGCGDVQILLACLRTSFAYTVDYVLLLAR